MVKKSLRPKLKLKEKNIFQKKTKRHYKKFKHLNRENKSSSNENYNEKELDEIDINEYLNGLEILDNFISDSNKEEMAFIKLPFHVNLIRKRNTGYTKYTKIYRKRMLKLIGFGNRFGPHYHKDESGHIYSMEYTDRITSKSLIFFRCQLKGCRAKGVLNSITKKFIVNQKHALPYENHIPNKKSNIKTIIEKTFAEKKNIKDIQIIFCRFHIDAKNKQKLNYLNNNISNLNNNINININNSSSTFKDLNNIDKIEINNNLFNNISFFEKKEEEKYKIENKNTINNFKDNNNKILVKKELTRGEIFSNYYLNKFNSGENNYDDYVKKIICANRENEKETKEYFYEVEINKNDYINNTKLYYYYEENKVFGNRYHRNLNNEVYLYSYDEYDIKNKKIIFLCKYEGCTGKAIYNLTTKKFRIEVPHLICYQLHFNNLYNKIDNYKKVMQIFEAYPEITDIQFILKYKK